MQKCEDRRCPSCYPNWREDEAAARKKVEDDRQHCSDYWQYYQKQAEAIVGVEDPIARNRRINAAYAQLWWDDRRFQWAGLAAFASKQVGCGLLNAAELISKSNRQRNAYQQWERSNSLMERMSPYASPRMPVHDQVSGEGAAQVYQMLAKGNTALFLDIWPLHMFYRKFGLRRFEQCLGERAQLRGSVAWPIAGSVPFGEATPEIVQGFRAIETGNVKKGVEALAQHEQVNILQPAMYEDSKFAILLRANHFAWALNIPTGSARQIQLTFANRCAVTGANANIEIFSKQPLANLADARQRMAFVMRAAQRFHELLQHPIEKHEVENSLYLIANPR